MKISAFTLAASAVALSSTALGLPPLIKRASNKAAVVTCFVQLFTSQSLSPACSETVRDDVGLVQSVDINNLALSFAPDESITLSSTDLKVSLLAFPRFSVPITKAKQHVTIVDNGIDIARFDSSEAPTTLKGTSLSTTLLPCLVTVYPQATDNFIDFVTSIFFNLTHTFQLKGTVDATVAISPPTPSSSPFGGIVPQLPSKEISFTNVGFSSNVTLRGVSGISRVEFVKSISLVQDPATGGFTLTSIMGFKNPSALTFGLGDIHFQTVDTATGVMVGMTVLKDFKLVPGQNEFTAVMTSVSKDVYMALTTVGAALALNGSATESSRNPIIARVIAKLDIAVKIPKLSASA
ncbi:hypothetical protein BGZ54_000501 [Gamsiella multidivaricata]|nr:hypothetical protein BGZ54_000501 [Gamsiella multidivaricata]